MFDLATAEPEVCPYLGLPDDPRTRFAFADQAHRLPGSPPPMPSNDDEAACAAAPRTLDCTAVSAAPVPIWGMPP